jgi:hypothetical protein
LRGLSRWVGLHLFHTNIIVVPPNGSGDTAYKYIQVFCFAAIAVVVAVLWTLLDRRRPNYVRLYGYLRIYVRFFLAAMMISYGTLKVIPAQFTPPSLERLVEPFGNASPMGLLWTFMGASTSYNIFTGLAEIVAGLLLTARCTTLLGALISAGVLSNVVLLNFSYDVPVKLISLHVLGMSLFLIGHDFRRLANVFILNLPSRLATPSRPPDRNWVFYGAVLIRSLLVAVYLGMMLHRAHGAYQGALNERSGSPFYGIWNVEKIEAQAKERASLAIEPESWRRIIFDSRHNVTMQLNSDKFQHYDLKMNSKTNALDLSRRDRPNWNATLRYERSEPEVLVLEGTWDNRLIRVQLRRLDITKFLLVNRGFHWINEYPFNR